MDATKDAEAGLEPAEDTDATTAGGESAPESTTETQPSASPDAGDAGVDDSSTSDAVLPGAPSVDDGTAAWEDYLENLSEHVNQPEPEQPEAGEESAPEPEAEQDDEQPENNEESADEPESPEEEPKGVNLTAKRQRIDDPVSAAAISIQRMAKQNGETISLAEAERRAHIALHGKEPGTEPEAEATPAPELPEGVPDTVEGIEARFQELLAEQGEFEGALNDIEIGRLEEIAKELRTLAQARPTVEQAQRSSQERQSAEYDERWNTSLARAQELYPDVSEEGSDLRSRSEEILALTEETFAETGVIDSRLLDASGNLLPTAPLIAAQLAAAELGVAPGRRAKAAAPERPAPPKPSSPTSPTSPGLRPASGSTSTADPATSLQREIEATANMTSDEIQEWLATRFG